MGVDLDRIGFGISSGTSRTGFGTIVSFPGASCPAAGTFLSWAYGVTYPIAEGGAYVYVTEAASDYPSQVADVQRLNDGSCGFYYDWFTATNINYMPYGVELYLINADEPISVEINSNQYQIGTARYVCVSDGYGSYTTTTINPSFYPAGTPLFTETNINLYIEVPSGSGNNVYGGYGDRAYFTNGYGGYYAEIQNAVWDSYGTFLYSDGTYNYYADGNGGYYYY
jgi:hypothetical protein